MSNVDLDKLITMVYEKLDYDYAYEVEHIIGLIGILWHTKDDLIKIDLVSEWVGLIQFNSSQARRILNILDRYGVSKSSEQ